MLQAHQKCTQGNEKLMYYISQLTDPADSFERLIYCSQLVQADCIRSNVEHMRRARGRCMGSAYWQLNDSNPVISWSSVDYFGRWKALHYAAARFYAPILISCDETDPQFPELWVTNDTMTEEALTAFCRLRNNKGEILREYRKDIISDPLAAECILIMDLSKFMPAYDDRKRLYLEYSLENDRGPISKGTTLFVTPKEFEFMRAGITSTIEDRGSCFAVTLRAQSFVKSVCLSLKDFDCVFSDNWFDIHGSEPVTVTIPRVKGLTAMNIRQQLKITSYREH